MTDEKHIPRTWHDTYVETEEFQGLLAKYPTYQEAVDAQIIAAWAAGARNVCAVMPTGAGKTVNMARRFDQHRGAAIGIAHRKELVGQMSIALARWGVRHRIIAPRDVCGYIATQHMDLFNRSYYDPNASVGVAGVDTLIRKPPTDPWFRQITLWQTDETHHLLRANKWGAAVELFPNALGIGWTATPGRADGYGLGRHADGVMDAMVNGPTMGDLIAGGYLTPFRLICPPSDIDYSDVPVGASGDYSQVKLRAAVHKSRIMGDIVQTYLRMAPGLRGVTFAVDVEHATEIAAAYRTAGVRAEMVTADTPGPLRDNILRKFRNGELDQLVNVDLFGEGFDLPAIAVVSMGRPTASFPLYAQQFGRALRPMEGKTHGIILDHADNTRRHGGPPSKPRLWSLDRRERRGPHLPLDGVPMRTCTVCTAPYERIYELCPYCGAGRPDYAGRSLIEVDGDLIELDPATMRALDIERARIDGVFRAPNAPPHVVNAAYRMHNDRIHAQTMLRDQIALWAGWQRDQGRADREIYKRFYWAFGTDIATAQTLNTADASILAAAIMSELALAGVERAAAVNPTAKDP